MSKRKSSVTNLQLEIQDEAERSKMLRVDILSPRGGGGGGGVDGVEVRDSDKTAAEDEVVVDRGGDVSSSIGYEAAQHSQSEVFDNDVPNTQNTQNRRNDKDSFTVVGSKATTHGHTAQKRVGSEPDPVTYRYPVILEDEGTGSDSYRNYGFDTNRIWTLANIGAIKCQRQCGGRGGAGGGKWIIECCSREQQTMITKITSLKTSRGVIKINARIPEEKTEGVVGPIPLDYTAEEIANLIQGNRHHSLKVNGVFRLKTKTGERSKAVRIVFYAKRLPQTVQIGTQFFRVEPYRREVKRCTRCQRLDHDKRECRSKQTARCPKCLEKAHPQGARECALEKSKWKCINCNQRGHSAAYGGCPEVLLRKKALEIQAQEYMPYATAMAKARKELVSKQTTTNKQTSSKPAANRDLLPTISRRRIVSSSPARPLNYAAAAKLGLPDVSAISKDEDHFSFGYRKAVPKQVDREERINTEMRVSTREKQQNESLTRLVVEENVEPKPSGNGETGLLGQIQYMMVEQMKIIEEKMREQSDRLNQKLETVYTELNKLSTERQKQLDYAGQIISRNVEQCQDGVTKCAFEVLECIRQAAQGNVLALMNFALRVTPAHLRSSDSGPLNVPHELEVALNNILPTASNTQ